MALCLAYWQVFFDEFLRIDSNVALAEKLKHRLLCKYARDYINQDILLGFVVSFKKWALSYHCDKFDEGTCDMWVKIKLDKMQTESKDTWRECCYNEIMSAFGKKTYTISMSTFSFNMYLYALKSREDDEDFSLNEQEPESLAEICYDIPFERKKFAFHCDVLDEKNLEHVIPISWWTSAIKKWPHNLKLVKVLEEFHSQPLSNIQWLRRKGLGISFAKPTTQEIN